MKTIKINDKKYTIDFEAVCAYIGYVNQLNKDKSSDAVIEAHIACIKNFYKNNEMAYDKVDFDKDLLPALDAFVREYQYI